MAAIALLVVGLAAAAGGAGWLPGDGNIDDAPWGRAMIGAAVAMGVGVVAVFVARRRGIDVLGQWAGTTIAAAVVSLLAVGALLGIATSPRQDQIVDEPTEPEPSVPSTLPGGSGGPGEGTIDPSEYDGGQLQFVDLDGDGLPDRDANGDLILVLVDRDGNVRARMQPCPPQAPLKVRDDTALLDIGCDGEVDGSIPISSDLLLELPPGVFEGDLDGLPDLATDFDDLRPGSEGEDPSGDDQNGDDTDDQNGDDADNDDDGADDKSDTDFGPLMKTILIIGAIALAVAALGFLLSRIGGFSWGRRRADEPDAAELDEPGEDEVDAQAVDEAIETSIEVLLASPDPRVAIRAAYAVLLDALAEAGFARLPSETPELHLARCLAGLNVEPRPMRELLDLFALARFSTHEITEDHRQRALTALRSSQEELRRTHAARMAAVPPFGPPAGPFGASDDRSAR